MERRIRRIRLMEELLIHLGFENNSRADFMDATLPYADTTSILKKLRLMGRIVLMTKQLDMALSSDSITQWYTRDFLKQLELRQSLSMFHIREAIRISSGKKMRLKAAGNVTLKNTENTILDKKGEL